MSSVDPATALSLKADALYLRRSPPGAAAWAGRGVEVKLVSPLATQAGAAAEGDRIAAFLGGPTVRDRAVVPGSRRDLGGKCVRIRCDMLGYSAFVPVFVLGAKENGSDTTLTVLRRLV